MALARVRRSLTSYSKEVSEEIKLSKVPRISDLTIIRLFVEFRNFEFSSIPFAKASESFQQKKSALLVALFLNRTKGGGVQSRQTLLEFFKEHVKNNGSKNAELSMKIGSIFNPKHPLSKLQEQGDAAKEAYYSVLKE